MKKNLWLAALVGVALTSCVSEESSPIKEQAQKMSFGSVLKTQSRANFKGEMIGDYASNEDFLVFCKSYKGKFNGWDSSDEMVQLFDAEGEVASPEGTVWTTEADHYWPSTGYALAVSALSPADLAITYVDDANTTDIDESQTKCKVSYGKEGLVIDNFKVADKLDDQYDLMYTNRLIDVEHINYANGFTPITLNFNHALSSIVFAAVKGQDDAVKNKDYFITGLSIVGDFVKTGDFYEKITETPAVQGVSSFNQTSAPEWDNLGARVADTKYTPTDFQQVEVKTGRTVITQGTSALLTIPQEVTDDMSLVLDFKVVDKQNVATTGEGGTGEIIYNYQRIIPLKQFKAADETIGEWKLGTRYVYEVTFGGTPKITFKPKVEEWIDGGTYIYTIQ